MNKYDNEDDALQDNEDEETQEPLLGPKSQQATIVQGAAVTPIKEIFEMEKDTKSIHKPHVPRDLCAELMGDWGRWQLRTVSIIYLSKIPAAWFMACIIFTAPAPWYGEYRCDLNDHATENNISINKLSHPLVVTSDGSMENDFCRIRIDENVENNTDQDFWDLDIFDTLNESSSSAQPCEKFQFKIDPLTTLITQYDLVCSKSILIAISQCFHLFGVLVGGIIATELMKHPRRVMMIGMVLQIPCGVATGYVPWFWLHVALRFLSAVFCAITFTPCGVIMGDIVGGRQKIVVTANFENSWSIGVILLPLIGYFAETWGQIYLAISLPTVLLMVLWVWIPDSPRWFLERGDIDGAKPILENAVKFNNSKAPIPDNFEELLKGQAIILMGKKAVEGKSTWMQLLKIRGAPGKILLVFIAWSLIFTSYYGTLLNIRAFGRTYLYYTTAIAGICEVIGCLVGFIFIMKSKQKWFWVGIICIITGILNGAIWLMPTHVDGSHMLLESMFISMLNKIGISACLCVLTTCTPELFPIPHKKRVMFSSTVMARIVFITAPLVGFTVIFGDGVSLSFFGILTIISGICTMLLTPLQTPNNLPDLSTVDVPTVWTVKIGSSELTRL